MALAKVSRTRVSGERSHPFSELERGRDKTCEPCRALAQCANCERVKLTRLLGDRTPRALPLAPQFSGNRGGTRYCAQ
jgi:hypothetical protein